MPANIENITYMKGNMYFIEEHNKVNKRMKVEKIRHKIHDKLLLTEELRHDSLCRWGKSLISNKMKGNLAFMTGGE